MPLKAKRSDPVWIYPKIDPKRCQKIIEELHLHPIMAQILVSRGYKDINAIQTHLYSKLPDLIDPFKLKEMNKAVERIAKAIDDKETILVYGDNDVDGMTSTAVLTEFLRHIGGKVSYYVPNRTELMGESVMSEALNRGKECGCKLLITVDCGITASKQIEEIVAEGIDVIVTDHHEPVEKIPLCVATLNPKVVRSTYPNRDITGVGVAFKLAHALTTHFIRTARLTRTQVDLKSYLDLVALGTIADMGALKGENRVLVSYGLQRFRRTKRVGLRRLCEVSELKIADVTASDLASKIAPRLNSLGRISDPMMGVELLLMRDSDAAEEMAQELDHNNQERQRVEQLVSRDVEEILTKNVAILNDKAIVLHSDKWHPGVIAIVATRLSKMYNRPTMILSIDKGVGKASIRTIPEFPLLSVLKENAELLLNFGGHDYAAGLSVREENIPELKKRFIAAANSSLQEQDIASKLMIDGRVDFDELTFDFMESLNLLEPHGNENPPPILFCDADQVRAPRIVGGSHLKLYLFQNGRQLEGIGFGMADRREQLLQRNLKLRVAFTPQVNTFQNKHSIQLLIRDFKVL